MRNKRTVSANLPDKVYEEVVAVKKELDLDDFTTALVFLIKVGAVVVNRRKDLKDPELVRTLEENFRSELLADYIASLSDDDAEAIYSVVYADRELRIQLRRHALRLSSPTKAGDVKTGAEVKVT